MKIKGLICLILSFLMVASLTACAGKSVQYGINEEGNFVYSIVRSSEATLAQQDAAKFLRNAMKDNFGCKISLIKDGAFEDGDDNYEILIGDTNREESAKAKEILLNNRVNNSEDFIVKVIDDKICINSVTDDMIGVAVDWFIHTYCQSTETWALLKNNYEFIYCPESTSVIHNVAGRNLGTFAVILPRKTSLLIGLASDELVDYFTNMNYAVTEGDDVDAETEYEVLIGDTTRKESENVKVEGDNYVIKVVGNKLIIKGGTHLATWRGVKAFVELLNTTPNGIDLSDGYVLNGKYDATEKGTYTLNWYDEFDGTSIDYNKWSDYRNDSPTAKSASSLGGYCYTENVFNETLYKGSDKNDKLVYQADGYIHLGTQRVNDKDFVNSRLSSYWTMTYRYGIMDIYVRLGETPVSTSLWVNGGSADRENFEKRFGKQKRVCMTEIDILENFGHSDRFAANVHRWWTNYNIDGSTSGSSHKSMDGAGKYSETSGNSKIFTYNSEKYGDMMTDDFHMISFYWDDVCMKFAFDGKVFCDYQYSENVSTAAHALMNYFISGVGMGSPSYGLTYDKNTSKTYYETMIDYIRIYQTDSINSQLITAWPQNQENGTSTIFYPEKPIGNTY